MNGNLKELRESRHLTQAGMGRKLGLAQQTISKYEKDISIIPIDILIKMAKFFNVTTDYILGISVKKRNEEKDIAELLQEEEYVLIEMYQDLDSGGRQVVLDMLASLRKNLEQKGDA